MCLNDLLYDGKSETGSLLVLATGEIRLVKAFPDLVQAVLRDADPGVFDRYKDFPVLFGRFDRNRRIVVAELDRVIDQVVDDLLDLAHVRAHKERLPGQDQFKGEMLFLAAPLERHGSHLDHMVDIEISGVQDGSAVRTVFIQLENAVGQLVQAFGLKQDDVQILVLQFRRDRAVQLPHSL